MDGFLAAARPLASIELTKVFPLQGHISRSSYKLSVLTNYLPIARPEKLSGLHQVDGEAKGKLLSLLTDASVANRKVVVFLAKEVGR
jgi:hypothetical protein